MLIFLIDAKKNKKMAKFIDKGAGLNSASTNSTQPCSGTHEPSVIASEMEDHTVNESVHLTNETNDTPSP